MRLNIKSVYTETTHEGAPAVRMTPEQALRRSVMSCFLWEREFYEDGQTIAARILTLCEQVSPAVIANLAIETRSKANLRHVPLLLLSALAKRGTGNSIVSEAIKETIQRADELAEFLAVYAHANGVSPDKVKPKLSNQVRKGLAMAFRKFNAYDLAKYNRDGAVKLRDALFLCHAKPSGPEQAEIWKQLIDGTLPAPDTWEVALSAGSDKKATWERLLKEGKLGYLALLRNLRNMDAVGVDDELVKEAILARKGAHRVLPFRYVAAARACPRMEPTLDKALVAAISAMEPFKGKTAVLVDVSGSMDDRLSGKSDLKRIDAAAALASIIPGNVRMFSFSRNVVEVPPRIGMAGVDAIIRSQSHGGTELGGAVHVINEKVPYDRLIVITDEQSNDRVMDPKGRGYMINVASAKNGVGYGKWVHIDGFSENVLKFIAEYERG